MKRGERTTTPSVIAKNPIANKPIRPSSSPRPNSQITSDGIAASPVDGPKSVSVNGAGVKRRAYDQNRSNKPTPTRRSNVTRTNSRQSSTAINRTSTNRNTTHNSGRTTYQGGSRANTSTRTSPTRTTRPAQSRTRSAQPARTNSPSRPKPTQTTRAPQSRSKPSTSSPRRRR